MPRRRRRGGGYPQQSTSTIEGMAPGDPLGAFPSQPDLGGGTGGAGFTINNINTAIAQAAVESGPGGINQNPTVGGGGHHHGGGGHHHGPSGAHHHRH